MKKLKKIFDAIEWEALMWLIGLFFLITINPYETQHFTLCPYKNLGIDFCPGCGLGRSISFFYHFNFLRSIKTHPLGIFAFAIIIYRIIYLIKRKYFHKTKKEVSYG